MLARSLVKYPAAISSLLFGIPLGNCDDGTVGNIIFRNKPDFSIVIRFLANNVTLPLGFQVSLGAIDVTGADIYSTDYSVNVSTLNERGEMDISPEDGLDSELYEALSSTDRSATLWIDCISSDAAISFYAEIQVILKEKPESRPFSILPRKLQGYYTQGFATPRTCSIDMLNGGDAQLAVQDPVVNYSVTFSSFLEDGTIAGAMKRQSDGTNYALDGSYCSMATELRMGVSLSQGRRIGTIVVKST